ncbi:Hypothetical protein A7982_02848 [Minicystis rosea]|nr:Hypothetical protein A7982_02848 [Minicystis rosea]
MHDLIAELLREHPEHRFRALGAGSNRAALDLAPYGHAVEFLDAAAHRDWVDRYHQANLARFPGALTLPGWVLVDLYLMPAAIGLLTCPARYLDVRPPGLGDDDEGIAAAYYAAPSITPGTVVGVSLISLREGLGGAALIKAMTLKMLRAGVQRGIAQWSNRSLRVHTRFGPLRLEGFVPGPHGKADESFVYTVDLSDEATITAHMKRRHATDPDPPEGARWYDASDLGSLGDLLRRAAAGERIEILPPGLSNDGKRVLVRHG